MEDNRASAPMDDAGKFRLYATECLRLAEKAAAQDKPILLELANAWVACAEAAERKAAEIKKDT
jgi:hypothetical protein